MKESYVNFNEKRMYIFSELVRRYWNGDLSRISDLEELDMMRKSGEIQRPIVSRIEGPCEYCGGENCRCETFGKYESPLYLKQKTQNSGEEKGNKRGAGQGCIECGFCVSNCDFGALSGEVHRGNHKK